MTPRDWQADAPASLDELLEWTEKLMQQDAQLLQPAHADKGRPIPELYARGKASFHIHLWVAPKGKDAHTCELCLTYGNALLGSEQGVEAHDLSAAPRHENGTQCAGIATDKGTDQGVVPVVYCELVEHGKPLSVGIRSVVRLQLLDECDGTRWDARQLAGARLRGEGILVAHAFGPNRSAEYREAVLVSRRLAARLGEDPDEMLQRGSGLVEDFADQDAQKRRYRCPGFEVGGVPAGLEIHLEADAQGFIVLEAADFVVKGANAGVYVLELGLAAG